MTLENALRLQDTWKANPHGETCQHNQLHDHLRAPNGHDLDYKV